MCSRPDNVQSTGTERTGSKDLTGSTITSLVGGNQNVPATEGLADGLLPVAETKPAA